MMNIRYICAFIIFVLCYINIVQSININNNNNNDIIQVEDDSDELSSNVLLENNSEILRKKKRGRNNNKKRRNNNKKRRNNNQKRRNNNKKKRNNNQQKRNNNQQKRNNNQQKAKSNANKAQQTTQKKPFKKPNGPKGRRAATGHRAILMVGGFHYDKETDCKMFGPICEEDRWLQKQRKFPAHHIKIMTPFADTPETRECAKAKGHKWSCTEEQINRIKFGVRTYEDIKREFYQSGDNGKNALYVFMNGHGRDYGKTRNADVDQNNPSDEVVGALDWYDSNREVHEQYGHPYPFQPKVNGKMEEIYLNTEFFASLDKNKYKNFFGFGLSCHGLGHRDASQTQGAKSVNSRIAEKNVFLLWASEPVVVALTDFAVNAITAFHQIVESTTGLNTKTCGAFSNSFKEKVFQKAKSDGRFSSHVEDHGFTNKRKVWGTAVEDKNQQKARAKQLLDCKKKCLEKNKVGTKLAKKCVKECEKEASGPIEVAQEWSGVLQFYKDKVESSEKGPNELVADLQNKWMALYSKVAKELKCGAKITKKCWDSGSSTVNEQDKKYLSVITIEAPDLQRGGSLRPFSSSTFYKQQLMSAILKRYFNWQQETKYARKIPGSKQDPAYNPRTVAHHGDSANIMPSWRGNSKQVCVGPGAPL